MKYKPKPRQRQGRRNWLRGKIIGMQKLLKGLQRETDVIYRKEYFLVDTAMDNLETILKNWQVHPPTVTKGKE